MRVKILFFCILFVQTSASFFDEFRGAMSSVETSFGKLLSDVVTDVRDTIGCTILAVKQVLALGGIFHESSEYDSRCRGVSDTPTYVEQTNSYAPTPRPFLLTTPSVYTTPPSVYTTPPTVTEKSLSEKVSEEMHESIKNLNQTMFELIGKSDTHEKMENVSSSLLHESNRLNKVGELLRREIDNISKEVKLDIIKTEEKDIHNPTIDEIWNNIKALHNVELDRRNTPQAAEVHHILNEVLGVLRGYNNYRVDGRVDEEQVNDKDLNKTFTQIKNQFFKIEEEESDDFKMVQDIVETDLNDKSNEIEHKVNDIPVSFKEVAKKIMDETSRTLSLSDEGDSQVKEELATPSTEETPTIVNDDDELKDDPFKSPEYVALFQIPEDSHSRKETAKEAQKLIEKSKETDAIMSSYFEKSSSVGTSVFDDPDLFNF